MDEQSKKRVLARVPTRKLLAAIKLDIRKQIRTAAAAPKPKKPK